MGHLKPELHCLNCKQSEREIPLLHLRYSGDELWICAQCLPTLIHAPQKLVGKLENAEKIRPAVHHEH
jgi:hypothetical protein